jgi:hypothetical protein
MIDRDAPYDSLPLIQKADHQITIGDDTMDSVIVKLPTVGSVNSPAAAFNVDFDFDDGRDRYDIDSTGSADDAFTITLSGLSDNQTGILNITKKSQDTFSFANGLITPFNNTEGQEGQTSIILFVKVVGSTYIVYVGYDTIISTVNIADDSVTNSKMADQSVSNNQLDDDISLVRIDEGSGGNKNVKVKNIKSQGWNMQSSGSLVVNTGVSNIHSTIEGFSYLIRDDSGSLKTPSTEDIYGVIQSNDTLTFVRANGGVYDSSLYNDSSSYRLIINIHYTY